MKKISLLIILGIVVLGCRKSSYTSYTSLDDSGFRVYYEDADIYSEPFQVIDARDAWEGLNKYVVGKNRYLNVEDTVYLDSGGFILMAHYSGAFLEYTGDTTLIMSNIVNNMSLSCDIQGEKRWRINLDGLYVEERNFTGYLSAIGAVSCPPNYDIDVVFPVTDVIDLPQCQKSFCIMWETQKSIKDYRITVRNIYDETIDELFTQNTIETIDFSSYPDLHHGLLLLKIENVDDSEICSPEVGVRLYRDNFSLIPEVCTSETASKALELAYYFENQLQLDLALQYYQLAYANSNEEIYRVILEKYKMRSNGRIYNSRY